MRLKNVIAVMDGIAEELWQMVCLPDTGSASCDGARNRIADNARLIDQLCAKAGAVPADLPDRSRIAYAWLAFLSDAANFSAHMEALKCARRALGDEPTIEARPVVLHLKAMGLMWNYRKYRNCLLFKCSEAFLHAPMEFWGQWLGALQNGDRPAFRRLAREYSLGDSFGLVTGELEALAGTPDRSDGMFFDLNESFDRVNSQYFDGKVTKPILAWSRKPTTRTFGTYQPSKDRLTVSCSLDAESVPEFLVDYIVYHELLHKHLGILSRDGRRRAHTPEFRAEERRFARYDEARKALDRLSGAKRG